MADGTAAAAVVPANQQSTSGTGMAQHHYEDYTRGGWAWDAESRTYRLAKPLPSEAELFQRYPPPSYIGPPYYYFQESYDQKQHRITLMRHNHSLKLQRVRRRKAKVVKLLTKLGKQDSLTEPVLKRVLALPADAHLSDSLLTRIIHQCDTTHRITSSLNAPADAAGGSSGLLIEISPDIPTNANASKSASPRGIDVDITALVEVRADADTAGGRTRMTWAPFLLHDCPECVHVLGQGAAGMVFAQSSVHRSRCGGTLLYFPPDATPPRDNPAAGAALGDSKEVLNRIFGPFRNREELLGRESLDKNRLPVHHSSAMYDTLVLSNGGDCMSMIMWKIVPDINAFWISWLATNAKYGGQGCGSLVLESVKAIAKGLGMEKLYLEVGVPSKMDAKGDRDLWAHAREFYDRKNFIVSRSIPEEIGACRMHGDDDNYMYEVLEFNLHKRELRKRKRSH